MSELDIPGVVSSIVLYSANYAPELTGIGRYAGELAHALADQGIRCTVVTSPPHYPEWRTAYPHANAYRRTRGPIIDVIRCPIFLPRRVRGITRILVPLSFAITSAPVIVWAILRRRPDIVLCVEPTLFAAPAALVASRIAGSRTVLHVQDLEIDAALEVGHLKRHGLVERVAHAFDRAVLRAFGAVVTISAAMQRRIVDKGVHADRVQVIRNWVDTKVIHPTGDPSYRRRLGIADDAFLVLYAGSVGAKQGIDLLCEAMDIVGPTRGIMLAVVGEGPAKAALLDRFGDRPQISFHGLQPEPALNALLNAADLHVIPQLKGVTDFALPSKLAGILASGRPLLVLGHPDQELATFVRNAAHVVEPDDAGTVASMLLRLATQRISAGADRRVALASELSKAKAVARFRALFERMVQADGDKGRPDSSGEPE